MLQEISRRSINIPNYEDSDIVWQNNVLTVRCDGGLHLFDFSYDLQCLDKTIDFLESKIHPSKFSPASELFPDNIMKCRMRNMDFCQMILDPALWPHNKQLMEVATISSFEWSPVDFIHNDECIIATLNSAGNIDMYSQARHKWVKLENLSQKLKNQMDKKSLIPPISHHAPLDFEKVTKTVYALETNCMCWAPVLNADKSCYFVTAQKNGNILFWLLKCEDNSINVKLLDNIIENTEAIIAMKWIPICDNRFMLICSNILGQIIANECEIVDNVMKHLNTHYLWPHRDKMVALYINYVSVNNNIILACNKHRHFLLQVIDKNCKVLLQNITNVNDHRITSIALSKNNFYVSTINRELYLVKYVIENETLHTDLVKVEVKGIPIKHELYSFAFSANDTLLALALLDRTVLCRKKPLELDIIFYAEASHDSELSKIVNNPSKSLTCMWDVIESLRCKTLKLKVLPSLDYNKLYKDAQTDDYYAKVYLIVLTLYNNLEKIIQNASKGLLPETSVEMFKNEILASHAVQLMTKLYEARTRENTEDMSDYQSYLMAGIYLEEFCEKSEKKLTDLLAPAMVDILKKRKNELKYTCQGCDELLTGFVCKDGHLNVFCLLTFTPIESNDYLICKGCGVTVRSDLFVNKPKCVFCDHYLCKCNLPL